MRVGVLIWLKTKVRHLPIGPFCLHRAGNTQTPNPNRIPNPNPTPKPSTALGHVHWVDWIAQHECGKHVLEEWTRGQSVNPGATSLREGPPP